MTVGVIASVWFFGDCRLGKPGPLPFAVEAGVSRSDRADVLRLVIREK